jgi:hypothetical protein
MAEEPIVQGVGGTFEIMGGFRPKVETKASLAFLDTYLGEAGPRRASENQLLS